MNNNVTVGRITMRYSRATIRAGNSWLRVASRAGLRDEQDARLHIDLFARVTLRRPRRVTST